MDSSCRVLAALGRPLYPGMLYDCRTDTFIPGVTLWDKKALHDDLDVHQQPKTDLKFAASDSLSDKANLLDISASLKASFLCGLVEVGGAAKYLNDTKSSAQQCRVTMQYSQTTKFEQLTMKELGNITYPQVFEQKTATHVVTAVLYGASAFMVFDYTRTDNQSIQDIEGNLNAVVKMLPLISIEGKGYLKMSEAEKNLTENISVTFYGDYKLNKNPTTYKEALEVYITLPSVMEKGNYDGVPLTVWLYPLNLLDDSAAKLVREINMRLVCKTEQLLDELGEVERQCNDLKKNQMTNNFPYVKGRLVKFQHSHNTYKIAFQKILSRVLPAIRDGAKEEKSLGDILNMHFRSPFSAVNTNKWLEELTTELNILSSYTSGLKNLTVVTSGSLKPILVDPNVDVVVCLSFTSLDYEDTYLVAIEDFLNSEEFTNFEKTNVKDFFSQAEPWFTSDISRQMRQNLSLFTSFLKANTNDKRMKFLIGSIPDSSNPGTSIRLYQEGHLKDPKFQPLSKPPLPVVEISDENVLLKLSKSPTGETARFRVEYRMTQPNDSAANYDVAWKVSDTPDAQTSFTLTQIKEAGNYCVQYRAVNDVGLSEASNSITFTFQKKPNEEVSETRDSVAFTFQEKPDDKLSEARDSVAFTFQERPDDELTEASDSVDFTFQEKSDEDVSEASDSVDLTFQEVPDEEELNPGIIRSKIYLMHSDDPQPDSSTSKSYLGSVPEGLRPGMALFFQGVVTSDCNSFVIDLQTDSENSVDVAFHFNPRMHSVVLNSYRNETWDDEETHGCPFAEGGAFDIVMIIKPEYYEVIVNGMEYCTFNHRMPVEQVTVLNVWGDVFMNIVHIIKVEDDELKVTDPDII